MVLLFLFLYFNNYAMVLQVKKLLPNLHIFNAKPVDKISAKEVPIKDSDFSVEPVHEVALKSDSERDHSSKSKNLKRAHPAGEGTDNQLTDHSDIASEGKKKKKRKRDEKKADSAQNEAVAKDDTGNVTRETEKKSKHKKTPKESVKEIKGNEAIDTTEVPFADLFAANAGEEEETSRKEVDLRIERDAIDAMSGLVTHLKSKKKKKSRIANPAAIESSQGDEIGLGGPSAWDDAQV